VGDDAAKVATEGQGTSMRWADYARTGNSWSQQVDLGRSGARGSKNPFGFPDNMNFRPGRDD